MLDRGKCVDWKPRDCVGRDGMDRAGLKMLVRSHDS